VLRPDQLGALTSTLFALPDPSVMNSTRYVGPGAQPVKPESVAPKLPVPGQTEISCNVLGSLFPKLTL
jgi:hypothetical protein